MTISFVNPGEIDLRLTQLFGVSVKEGESPIGFFGTGSKYAIAVTLRLGGKITIWSGLKQYTFSSNKISIRGKEFDQIFMCDVEANHFTTLPFTLDLGKTWEPWMAYREFWSNAIDEAGQVFDRRAAPQECITTIWIEGADFDNIHKSRDEFILNSSPIWENENLAIHLGPNKKIFYKGLKVYTMDMPGMYTYNLKCNVGLTEDRTISNIYIEIRQILRELTHTPKDLISVILLGKNACWEHKQGWDIWWDKNIFPQEFKETVLELARRHRYDLPQELCNMFLPKTLPAPTKLTVVEQKSLDRAKDFCTKIHIPITYPIIVTESLAEDVLGGAMEGHIILTKEVFRQGTKRIAGTLIEEQVHLETLLGDMTRGLQNYLLDTLVSLGEELLGEPL